MSVTKRALFLSPVVRQGGFDCSGGGSYNRGEKDGFPSDVGTSLSKKGWWLLSVGAGFKSQENAKEGGVHSRQRPSNTFPQMPPKQTNHKPNQKPQEPATNKQKASRMGTNEGKEWQKPSLGRVVVKIK